MDNLPVSVSTCTDPDLKEFAIAAFTRGTLEEKNMALLNCAKANNKANQAASIQAQKYRYEHFKTYFESHSFID